MATNVDILKKLTDAKAESVDFYDAWAWYLLAKNEAPEALADFEKLLELRGVKNRTPEDEGFRAALQQFAKNFARGLLPKEEEKVARGDEGQEDLESSLVPREVLERARTILADKVAFESKYKERFVSRLVDNYIKQSATSINRERLRNSLSQIAESAPDEASFSQEALGAFRKEAHNAGEAAVAQRYFTQGPVPEDVHAYYSRDAIWEEITRVAPFVQTTRPDVAAEILIEDVIDNPTTSIDDRVKILVRDMRIVDVMAAGHIEDESAGARGVINNFFRSYADTGLKKTLAPAADVAVSLFGPDTQFAVAEILTGKAFKNVVHDERFEAHIKAVAPEYLPALSTLRSQADVHLKTLVDKHDHSRVAMFFYHLASGPEQAVRDSIEIQAKHAGLLGALSLKDNLQDLSRAKPLIGSFHDGLLHHYGPEGASFLLHFWLQSRDGVMAVLRRGNAFSSYVAFQKMGDVAGWILRWGAGRAGGAAKAALGRWALGAFAGKTVGALLGAVGGPIGMLIGGIVGDFVIGKVFGGIKGLFGGIGNLLRFGYAGKRKWYDDPGSFGFALFLVVVPLVLIFFLSFQTMSMLSGAFFVTSPRSVGGSKTATPVRYSGAIPSKASEIDICPLASTITQRPHQEGTTHDGADAFDYADPMGTPVAATHDGYLVGGCSWDQNLGNYVRMVGANADGTAYFTTYAHLLDGCSSAVAAASPGTTSSPTPIAKGTTIGYVGSTGNSTGPHLHFQYNGPGSLSTSRLPKSCGGSG